MVGGFHAGISVSVYVCVERDGEIETEMEREMP